MDRLIGAWRRVRAILWSGRAARELESELRFHVEMEADALEAQGLSPSEARRRARVAFGSADRFAEEARETRGAPGLADAQRDLRHAIRRMWREPRFTIAAVLTLGIGIGATTAIFTVVNAVLLDGLPFEAPHRLVAVWESDRGSGTRREPSSWPDVVDMRERVGAFAGVAAVRALDGTLTGLGEAEQVSMLGATPNTFDVLGIAPLFGTGFAPGSGATAGGAHAMLSEDYWRARFDGDRDIVGRVLVVNGRPLTITGVLPAGADLGIPQLHAQADYASPLVGPHVDMWVSMEPDESEFPRETHPFLVIARLRPEATLEGAQAQLTALMTELEAGFPENADRGASLERWRDMTFGPVRPVMLLLLAGGMLVLVIATVNVANLLLVRTAARSGEVALRQALGAAGHRITRQFLVEGAVLAAAAAALGAVLATFGLRVMIGLAPEDVPRLEGASPDLPVLVFTAAVALLIAVGFGLVPVRGALRANPLPSLTSQATSRITDPRRSRRFRDGLVVAEIAFAVCLGTAATLLLRSQAALDGVDPGFRPAGLVKAEYQLPAERYPMDFARWPELPEILRFHDRLLAEVRRIPGVQHAALASSHPLDAGSTNSFTILGREAESAGYPEIRVRMISEDYARAAGVPVIHGRAIEASDVAGQPPVILVNQAAAEAYFPGQDPIGQGIRFWGLTFRIVGVIGDERFNGPAEDAQPAVYGSIGQVPFSRAAVLLRADDAPATLAAVAAVMRRIDPAVALTGAEPLSRTLERTTARSRFAARLIALFGAVAIAMALIGVYGVLSYTVAQRRSELGIRMALGATRRSVVVHVLRQGATLAVLGTAAGMLLALGASGALRSLVFGLEPHDPLTFAMVAGGMLVMAVTACVVPALRAAGVAPMAALRSR